MLANLGNMALAKMATSNHFVPASDQPETATIEETKSTLASTGPTKVGSYAHSKWLYDTGNVEVRVASLYDLETEVEVI